MDRTGLDTPPTPVRGGRAFARYDSEGRALAKEAYALWRDLAVARSNPYNDHTACLLAGRMAVDATRWEDGLVILNAIRQRMDERSSPRWIPEWAREAGGRKRETARNEARRAEADAVADMDPEVRRVIVEIARAKARGQRVSASDVMCVECRGLTEGKCPTCGRALHPRACPQRHECAA